eukprot:TRINITY_DN114950_c0_g1_i1.p1 TRINITY_DN114950_c0_g1~~TRINITY_DN114950_c0_g1_i1.p1  ORF type:complete len:256 (+),score=36.72 TRINITY_DN114950_c0_g1_i1:53-769(+)
MVLPLGGPQMMITGPPTDEMLKKMIFIRYSVITTYVCVIGRFLANDVFGAFNDLLSALAGTLLLKEDATMKSCFALLQDTPLGTFWDGGMNCIVTYAIISMMNGVFGLLKTYSILTKMGTLLPCTESLACFLPIWLLLSTVAQLAGLYFSWKVYQDAQRQMFGLVSEGDRQGSGGSGAGNTNWGGGTLGTGGRGGRAGDQERVAGGAGSDGEGVSMSTAAGGGRFQPFQGTGHQLGGD